MLSTMEITEEKRESFLRSYLDLIATMGQANKSSRLWWATDISSKNRFESKLIPLLQEFLYEKDEKRENRPHHPQDRIKGWFQDGMFRLRRIASLFFHTGRIYTRAVYARLYLSRKIRRQLSGEKSFYVIRSFTYDRSFSSEGTYRDPFFGEASEYIKRKRDVLILTDILGDFTSCVKRIQGCTSHIIIPLEYFISIGDILGAVVRILTCRIRIDEDLDFEKYPVACIIRRELKRTLNGIRIYQLLNYESVRNLLRITSVDTFLLTYENNPWEKMCILAIREFSPRTRIIGFQHNVIPQASTNLFIGSREKDFIPKPDWVLTTGEIPKKIMERYGALDAAMIKSACAVRHEYLFTLKAQKRSQSNIILLALEGIFDVYTMVNYCLRQLGNSSAYKILIRTHPALPIKKIQHKLIAPLGYFRNVIVSEGKSRPLKEDIQEARMAMYRSSTVGMESLWMGRPVIHYDNGSLLSFDPLFDCPHLKWRVNENSSLVSVIKDIEAISDQEFQNQEQKAREYLHRYFYPVNEENLRSFLEFDHEFPTDLSHSL